MRISPVGKSFITAQAVDPAAAPQEEAPEEVRNVFNIPVTNMAFLQDKIEKLNKAALKLKLPPITVEILGDTFYEKKEEGSITPIKIPLKIVKIDGHAPKLNGWILAARVLHTPEGNIIKATPDAGDLPADYRNTPPICEHCKTNRDRRDTFLVKNDKGEIKQVGRNCLADFLGHPDPLSYARWAEMLSDLFSSAEAMEGEEGEGGMGGGGPRSYTTEQFLQVVAAMRRSFGWMSRTVAKQREEEGKHSASTADMVLNYLSNANAQREIDGDAKKLGRPLEFKPEDQELVTKALEWIHRIKEGKDSNEALSDYLWNLAVAASSAVVTDKTAGIVASLLSAYEKANSVLPTQSGSAGKGFLGEVNKAVLVKGTLVSAKPISSFRGQSTLFGIQDENGNLVKWFDNSNTPAPGNIGEQVMATGIVKEHKIFNGKPETSLQGARFLDQTEYEKIRAEQAVAAEAAKEKAGAPAAPPAQYTPGQKIPSIDLTLVDKRYIEGQYGTTTIHTFLDDAGRSFKWFASKDDLDVGHKYTLKATVKGEEEYQGVKSVMLTRAEVLQVGGEKAITKKDINAKRKELGIIDERITALVGKQNEIEAKINEMIRAKETQGQRVSYIGKPITPQAFDNSTTLLQGQIEKAKEAIQTQTPFKPNLEGLSYMVRDELETFRRSKTPQEFLKETDPFFKKMTALMQEVQGSGLLPELQQKQQELEVLRNSGKNQWSPEISAKQSEINAIETKIRTIQYKHPEASMRRSITDSIGWYKKIQDEVNRAQQAAAAGEQEFKFNTGDWDYNVQDIHHRPLEPKEFVPIAEQIIKNSTALEQEIGPMMQEHARLTQELAPIQVQYERLRAELNELESMKGKARKKAALAWVMASCKFAQD